MRIEPVFLIAFSSLSLTAAAIPAWSGSSPNENCAAPAVAAPLKEGGEIEKLKARVIVENHHFPFLSVTLKSAKFRGKSPIETREKVEAFLQANGFRMDSYVDYDITLFVSFEPVVATRSLNPFAAIKRGLDLDGRIARLKKLSYVEDAKLIHHQRLGQAGRLETYGESISVTFKKGLEAYEPQVAELKLIMGPDYEARPVGNEDKAGTIWASAAGNADQEQLNEEEMGRAVSKLKANGEDKVLAAEMHFKLSRLDR